MLKSRLMLKAFCFIFIIVAGCALAISFYSMPLVLDITSRLEKKSASDTLDMVFRLVQAKRQDIESYKKSTLDSRKKEMRDIVSIVRGFIETQHAAVSRGEISQEQGQQAVLETLRRFLYGNADYVWVADFDSVLISHPDDKLHGKSFAAVKDVYDNLIVPPMVAEAREKGSGFYSYWWNRLGRDEPSEKLSYFELFEPWSWVFGTGLYLDDIVEEVRRKKAGILEELRGLLSGVVIGRTGYMYVFDSKGMLIHPTRSLEGTDFYQIKNPLTGQSLGLELIEASMRKENSLVYIWDRPDDPGHYVYNKISWVRYFGAFDWYIGSSVYVDELHEASTLVSRKMAVASFLVFLAALALGIFFFKRLLHPIQRLSETALRVRGGDLQVRSGIRRKDEIGILAREFDDMVQSLQGHVETLDAKVQEKTEELSRHYEKLQQATQQIKKSIRYARRIQTAVMPPHDALAARVADYFIIWRPKDLIGGDLLWFADRGPGVVLAVIDCTGHGVPGAIMTMIAATSLESVLERVDPADPARVLAALNRRVKDILARRDDDSPWDDGLDIGLCYLDSANRVLTFAGAGISLFMVQDGHVSEVKGGRHSIGYRSSDRDCRFTNHALPFPGTAAFYLATDGLLDQIGGDKELPFGKSRLRRVIAENHQRLGVEQRAALFEAFTRYKGRQPQRDDVTVLGFTV